jgi:hypothetical protein
MSTMVVVTELFLVLSLISGDLLVRRVGALVSELLNSLLVFASPKT